MISVVMPAYNAEKTIGDSVRSVLAQTETDWELLIVSDAPSDGTERVIEAFSDPRIRLLRNSENQGAASSRNRGVREAKGDWIAFLDSDDLWEKEKLQRTGKLLEKYPEGKLLFTGSAFLNSRGEKLNYILHVPEKISRTELLSQNLISCSSVMVRKETMLRHPMPEERDLHEDFCTWLSILSEEPYAYGLDEPLLLYRLTGNSRSGDKRKAALMNWNTYRRAGIPLFRSVLSMLRYTANGLRKYRSIRKEGVSE